MKQAIVLVLSALAAVVAFVFLASQPAEALADPLGKMYSYQVSCAATAGGTRLVPSSGSAQKSLQAYKFWVNSATPVYFGGSDIDSTHGMPYCTASASCVAAMDSVDGSPNETFCLSSSGSVTVTVWAGRK